MKLLCCLANLLLQIQIVSSGCWSVQSQSSLQKSERDCDPHDVVMCCKVPLDQKKCNGLHSVADAVEYIIGGIYLCTQVLFVWWQQKVFAKVEDYENISDVRFSVKKNCIENYAVVAIITPDINFWSKKYKTEVYNGPKPGFKLSDVQSLELADEHTLHAVAVIGHGSTDGLKYFEIVDSTGVHIDRGPIVKVGVSTIAYMFSFNFKLVDNMRKGKSPEKEVCPLFVRNFDLGTPQSKLEQVFSKYGRINCFNMKSGGNAGSFAFVYFKDEGDAEDAIRKLDNKAFGDFGRKLTVKWARAKHSPRPSRPRRDSPRPSRPRRDSPRPSRPRRDSPRPIHPNSPRPRPSSPRRDSPRPRPSRPRRDSPRPRPSRPRRDSPRPSRPNSPRPRPSSPRRDSPRQAIPGEITAQGQAVPGMITVQAQGQG